MGKPESLDDLAEQQYTFERKLANGNELYVCGAEVAVYAPRQKKVVQVYTSHSRSSRKGFIHPVENYRRGRCCNFEG